MTKIYFEVVRVKATKKWNENGKRRQETREFSQTINPWNINKNGQPKTRQEIWIEINAAQKEWLEAKP